MTGFDTAPEARRVQTSILKGMTPQARVEMAASMSEDARAITLGGIRRRHPDWDEKRVRRELLVLMYGAELVGRAWPDHE